MAKAMHRCTTDLRVRFNENRAAADAVVEVDGCLLWSDVELLGPREFAAARSAVRQLAR
jgi:hypothetical protein